jgi:hypothetical protein
MTEIVLTAEQVAALKDSHGKVRFTSADGNVTVHVSFVERRNVWDSLSEEDRQLILSRLQNPQGRFATTQEVIAEMKSRFGE